MGDNTGIEWTEATWNPLAGCSIVSKECSNCYAMKMAHRLAAISQAHEAKHGGDPGPLVHYRDLTKVVNRNAVWTGKVNLAPDTILRQPLRWTRPRKIFVNSMSDLFHESVPDAWIDTIFAIMALCPQHTFQVLTKRPQRMRDYMLWREGDAFLGYNRIGRIEDSAYRLMADVKPRWDEAAGMRARDAVMSHFQGPPYLFRNIWLGTSVGDQAAADERVRPLLDTPAIIRFLSCEPLLGPVDLSWNLNSMTTSAEFGVTPRLDWVIAGGESGPGARPMHPDWARSLRDQCQAGGVPFFFKQHGEWAPGENVDRTSGIVETAKWFNDRWKFGHEDLARSDGHRDDQPDLYRIGKKAAGRLLDGRTWDEMPVTLLEAA